VNVLGLRNEINYYYSILNDNVINHACKQTSICQLALIRPQCQKSFIKCVIFPFISQTVCNYQELYIKTKKSVL